jgi:hypothetical protein
MGTDSRQTGPLAPVDYTHNGEEWQAQTQFNPVGGVVCRLFPNQPWVAASPAWEMDSRDGTYEVVFKFSHPNELTPHLGGDEFNRPPAATGETLLLIGQSVPDETDELQLNEGFGVIHRSNPDLQSLLWIGGKQWGEFEPGEAEEITHTIRLRWTQLGGVVRDIEAELDGQILKDEGGFSLAAPKVQFGGRGRFIPGDYEAAGINCLNILQLTYSKK